MKNLLKFIIFLIGFTFYCNSFADTTLSSITISSATTYNDNIIIPSGVTLTINNQLTINGNLTVQAGGIITHSQVAVSSFNLIVSGTLDINSGGKIDVSGKGISSAGADFYGASYGGVGSSSSKIGYGDIYNPVDVGSYGMDTSFPGGGLVRVTTNNLINNGSILANSNGSTFPGSGGGININVNSNLSGIGTYKANGLGSAYYGGGGRIAIKYNSLSSLDISTLKSKIECYGQSDAGAGTIYIKNISSGDDYLLIKDDSTVGKTSLPFSSFGGEKTFGNVRLISNFSSDNNLIIPTGNTLNIANPFSIDGNYSLNSNYISLDNQLTINGDLTVQSGGIITHSQVAVSGFNLVVSGTLDINSGGKIDVSGKGISSAGADFYGASYGGVGSSSSKIGYGDIYNPVDVGSYGMDTSFPGGGLVRVTTNNLINNGSILANSNGSTFPGSGGGININVNSNLSGIGTYKANGLGSAYYGGGGRIAIKYNSLSSLDISTLKSKIECYGQSDAGAGTIYLKNISSGDDYLLIKDDSTVGKTSLPFSSFGGEKTFGNVRLISNFSSDNNLIIPAGNTLNIANPFSIDGNYSLNSNYISLDNQLTINGDLTVQSGGIITHSQVAVSGFNLVVSGTLDINSGGKIDVSGKGISSAGADFYGASYGGVGSSSSKIGYGDIYNPVDVGSYGMDTSFPGGGLVRVTTNNLINNGSILANSNGSTFPGSGGGININVNSNLSGIGTYKANGLGSVYYGGGGRIAIKYNSLSSLDISTLKSKIECYGQSDAGAGTIYLKNISSGDDYLLIKDEGTSGGKYTGVGTGYTDYLFNTIEVGTGAKLYKLGTENIYGKTCITNGIPIGVIDTNISCNGNPGFIYYDIGATIKGLSSISRNYEFVILDQPSNGGIFITSSSGAINGNGTASSKLKISKIGNYKILFNLYNGTASGSEIYKSLQKNISVTK